MEFSGLCKKQVSPLLLSRNGWQSRSFHQDETKTQYFGIKTRDPLGKPLAVVAGLYSAAAGGGCIRPPATGASLDCLESTEQHSTANPRLCFMYDDTDQPTLCVVSADGLVPRCPESVGTDRYQQWTGFSVLSDTSFGQIQQEFTGGGCRELSLLFLKVKVELLVPFPSVRSHIYPRLVKTHGNSREHLCFHVIDLYSHGNGKKL